MPLRLGIMAALLLALAAPARADIVLDQSFLPPGPGGFQAAVVTGQSVAQTFTAGLSGVLAEVDVLIQQDRGTTGDVTLTIYSVAGGVPTTTSLFTSTIPLATIPVGSFSGLTSVDVSSADIMVNPGDELAIALSRTGPGSPPWVTWESGASPSYAGGIGFLGDPGAWVPHSEFDFEFQTFVQTAAVPEPSSLALGGLGGVALAGYARRRRSRLA